MGSHWASFYFSARGRITRKQYWLWAVLLLFVAEIVISLPIQALFGASGGFTRATTDEVRVHVIQVFGIPVSVRTSEVAEPGGFALQAFNLLISGLSTWIMVVTTTKRLHDRNLSGWWQIMPMALGVCGAAALLGLLVQAGVPPFGEAQTVKGAVAGPFVYVSVGLLVAAFGSGFWLLFGVLLRRGKPGLNRFGPDPLAVT